MSRACASSLVAGFLLLTGAGVTSAQTNLSGPPPLPPLRSPVDTFRDLLFMTPVERTKALAERPAASRHRLLEKLAEYQRLPLEERELRLHATELRWWLLPLMRQPTTNRMAGLAQAPARLQPLLRQRLELWDMLPPGLHQELLDNEDIAQLFLQAQGRTKQELETMFRGLPPERQAFLQAGLDRWTAMSADQRRLTCERFDRYLELNPRERAKVLGTISESERRKMEEALKAFEKLPRDKRIVCVQSFEKFANMNPAERLQFFKNVETWEKLSPTERQAWRNLVSQVPNFPPLPPGAGEAPVQLPPTPPLNDPNPTATNGGKGRASEKVGGGG